MTSETSRSADTYLAPPNPAIELASPNDLAAIADCMQPVYADTYPNDRGIKREMFENQTFRAHLEEYLEERLEDPLTRVWIAREGQRVIVTIGLQISEDGEGAELWGFYVLPSIQDQGIGTKLWEKLMGSEEAGHLMKIKLVVAKDSEKAIKYYKTRGFEITGEEERNWPSWTPEPLVNQYWHMEKSLS